MEFIVDRKIWDRSTPKRFSDQLLLNDRGNMCCLGFVMEQLGVNKSKLLDKHYPCDVINKADNPDEFVQNFNEDLLDFAPKSSFEHGHVYDSTGLSQEAGAINDDDETSDKEKEEKLEQLFAKYNHSITFIN